MIRQHIYRRSSAGYRTVAASAALMRGGMCDLLSRHTGGLLVKDAQVPIYRQHTLRDCVVLSRTVVDPNGDRGSLITHQLVFDNRADIEWLYKNRPIPEYMFVSEYVEKGEQDVLEDIDVAGFTNDTMVAAGFASVKALFGRSSHRPLAQFIAALKKVAAREYSAMIVMVEGEPAAVSSHAYRAMELILSGMTSMQAVKLGYRTYWNAAEETSLYPVFFTDPGNIRAGAGEISQYCIRACPAEGSVTGGEGSPIEPDAGDLSLASAILDEDLPLIKKLRENAERVMEHDSQRQPSPKRKKAISQAEREGAADVTPPSTTQKYKPIEKKRRPKPAIMPDRPVERTQKAEVKPDPPAIDIPSPPARTSPPARRAEKPSAAPPIKSPAQAEKRPVERERDVLSRLDLFISEKARGAEFERDQLIRWLKSFAVTFEPRDAAFLRGFGRALSVYSDYYTLDEFADDLIYIRLISVSWADIQIQDLELSEVKEFISLSKAIKFKDMYSAFNVLRGILDADDKAFILAVKSVSRLNRDNHEIYGEMCECVYRYIRWHVGSIDRPTKQLVAACMIYDARLKGEEVVWEDGMGKQFRYVKNRSGMSAADFKAFDREYVKLKKKFERHIYGE